MSSQVWPPTPKAHDLPTGTFFLFFFQLVLSNCGAGEYLRVPWAARRSNQVILKEINPEYSLEGLTLKLQYFGR